MAYIFKKKTPAIHWNVQALIKSIHLPGGSKLAEAIPICWIRRISRVWLAVLILVPLAWRTCVLVTRQDKMGHGVWTSCQCRWIPVDTEAMRESRLWLSPFNHLHHAVSVSCPCDTHYTCTPGWCQVRVDGKILYEIDISVEYTAKKCCFNSTAYIESTMYYIHSWRC